MYANFLNYFFMKLIAKKSATLTFWFFEMHVFLILHVLCLNSVPFFK